MSLALKVQENASQNLQVLWELQEWIFVHSPVIRSLCSFIWITNVMLMLSSSFSYINLFLHLCLNIIHYYTHVCIYLFFPTFSWITHKIQIEIAANWQHNTNNTTNRQTIKSTTYPNSIINFYWAEITSHPVIYIAWNTSVLSVMEPFCCSVY